MKVAACVPFVALATAFILPDQKVFNQIAKSEKTGSSDWEWLPSSDQDETSFYDDVREAAVSSFIEEELDAEWGGHHHHHHPHTANLTISQLISKSNHTTKFAKIVDEFDDIVDLLNSTKANHTLFVPTDEAFKHVPSDKKPDKDFVEAVLKYHIGLGLLPARRFWASNTVPTALDEKLLGDKPQRLRTSAGLGGVRVNFYSKVVAANIPAKNGLIHAVNKILVPPPFIGKEISLFPAHFSTLLLAYEKTDFVKFIHNVPQVGSTVFAPTNAAFARLGPRANAFLFNTEKGKKYLTALLKYQIVVNTTLYSDAIYSVDADEQTEKVHYDLETLLDEKPLSVDILRLGGFVRIHVNGHSPVVVADGVAKNGVLQVVGALPIPPHKHKKHGEAEYDGGHIEVEDLVARLEDVVEDGDDDWASDL